MASPHAAGVNVSSGVMAKLQKWMGKASAKPYEIRTKARGAQHQSVQISHSNNTLSSPIHVRTRSAPVPMPEMELRATRRRKASASTPPPTHSLQKESEHESEKQTIHLEPKNGIPRAVASRSVGRNDLSLDQSGFNPQKQCIANTKRGRRASVGAVEPADETDSRRNFVKANDHMKEIKMNSRATKTVNKTARERSCDNSEESGPSDNEKIGSSSGSPNNGVQKLPEQIETRLRKWVEKTSLVGSKRNRVSSEESISSTDDSLNPPESPTSRPAAGQGGKYWKRGTQAKEMQELKLALKELVENVGVRVGRTTEKDPSSPTSGLGGQKANSTQVKTAYEGKNKEIAKCKYGSTDYVSMATRSMGSRKNSSSSDSDGGFRETGRGANGNKTLHALYSKLRNDGGVADKLNQCELEDYAKCALMNDDIRNRELNNNRGQQARKSVTLQEVLISETLIEESAKQEDDDIAKETLLPNDKKTSEMADRFDSRNIGNFSSKVEGCKEHSGETDVSRVPKGTEHPKLFFEEGGTLKPENGISKKLKRPGLQKRSTAPADSLSLRVNLDSTPRERMRHCLNFKDSELSAFAEECVRHAIIKKRNSHGEDGNNRIDFRKAEATDDVQKKAADSTPPGDQSHSTKAPKIRPKAASLPNEEAAKEIAIRDDKSHFIFARTAEEAEWFEKELGGCKRGKHAKDKASLERLHSNPLQETGTQRLCKFPSLPMFYTPQVDEATDPRKRSKTDKALYRRSVAAASFPNYPDSALMFGSAEPPSVVALCDGAESTSDRRSHSKAKSSSSSKLDQVGKGTVEGKGRPSMRKRKLSVPSRLGRHSNSSLDIRVGIEALI